MRKASGEDKIPPRLVKIAGISLSGPPTDINNTAIDTNTFSDRAKLVSVKPISKSGNDKHICTNYRPVKYYMPFKKLNN